MLDRLISIASQDRDLKVLLLSGSRAIGTHDKVSDYDLVALGEPDDLAGIADRWIAAFDDTVFCQRLDRGVPLVNLILDDWTRIDLLARPLAHVGELDAGRVKVLHDPDGLASALTDNPAAPPASSAFIDATIREFLRVLGLLHVCTAREDWALGITGWNLLREKHITLLRAENPAPQPGGILHLKADLEAADYAALSALPTPAASRESVIEAHRALAEAALPRAQKLLEARDGAWPASFADATFDMLEARVPGFTCPREVGRE